MERPKIEYIDLVTGEVTDCHRTAVEWYRLDHGVQIYRNGRPTVWWEPMHS